MLGLQIKLETVSISIYAVHVATFYIGGRVINFCPPLPGLNYMHSLWQMDEVCHWQYRYPTSYSGHVIKNLKCQVHIQYMKIRAMFSEQEVTSAEMDPMS